MRVRETIENPIVRHAAVAAIEVLGFVAATTVLNHRQETHRSLKLKPGVERVARGVMRMTGVEPAVWASVHTVHHGVTDANMVPIIELADYLEFRDQNPDIDAPPLPETFAGLDPVAELTPDDVRNIGGLAMQKVEGRYEKPTSYTAEDEDRLLDPETPRYFYPERPSLLQKLRRRRRKQTEEEEQPQADIHRLSAELRDPHSPPLHRNGTRGVLLENVPLYGDAARWFADEKNRPDHLKKSESDESGHPSKRWMLGFVAGNIVLAGLMRGGRKPRDLVKHAAIGTATALTAYQGLKAGGDVTNAFGHGGKYPIRSAITNNIEVRDDGTYPSNAPVLSLPTLDEVGGQYYHHLHPEWVAYTPKAYGSERSWRRFVQAPFGSMLMALADRGIGMENGPGFDTRPGELRPDVPSEAVLELQQARIRTLESKQKQPGN
jgi:hypothetical protein